MAEPRVLIVDDEPLARQRLKDLLGDIGGYQLAGEAANGVEAMALLQQAAVEIVLLDIRMPLMDGIELAQHLRQLAKPPAVVFTTAYDSFAVQAFELNAIDYLLKPIRAERLATALARLKPLQTAQWQALQPLQQTQSHLSIHERGRVLLVPMAEVLYCRAELKYVTVRTLERSYLWEGALSQLEQQYADQLLRVHRNALVTRAAIAGFERLRVPGEAGDDEQQWVVVFKGIPDTIAVSRRHQHLIKSA